MTKRTWAISCLTVVLGIVLFGGGVVFGQRFLRGKFGAELRYVQGSLLFDRIVQEREIKALLTRGCIPEAIGEISNQELADRKTLSSFVHENPDRDTVAYINKRDSHFLSELDSPAGSFANTWPGCQK
jgi:hypothetical protein